MSYTPPYHITATAVNLIAEISEKIGMLTAFSDNPLHVQLRKKNRIKTIQSSLAIENNTLTIDQITAIVEGKRILGPPKDILEVKNAVKAYDILMELNPYKEKDLLKAHRMMMADLVSKSGEYRTSGVGIFNGKEVIHVAPPAQRVPLLMSELFEWLKKSKEHPLIKSCVFHYEFEYIHPFEDGNGRTGRLWQTVILKKWKPVFAWIPVETLVKKKQQAYYNAFNVSNNNADSTVFIDFMLALINDSISEILDKQNDKKVTVKVTVNQQKIINALKDNPFVTQKELATIVGITEKSVKSNMKKLQQNNIIRRIGADKNGHWELISPQ
jgi:Fic family protein